MFRFMQIIRLVVVSVALVLSAAAREGRIVRETVHAVSLENSVSKENPDRKVSIYLPPTYDSSPTGRYPVIYLLHGIGDTDETWTTSWTRNNDGYWAIQNVMDKGIAEGKFGEMIVVMPDNKTNWFGSFYINSNITGNWDDFNSAELVRYIDTKYRTLNDPGHRGILGHSMGGFGALSLGMRHPDVFSVVYAMNPAIIDWGADLTIASPAFSAILKARSFDELLATKDLYTMATVTLGQAFSPNPNKPPFYVDLPFKMVEGKLEPDEPGFRRWRENSLIRMVDKYQGNLRKLRGLRFDSGYEDEFRFIPVNSRSLSIELTNYGVEHTFEEYNGDHRNRMWGRQGRLYSEILPYLWEMLKN